MSPVLRQHVRFLLALAAFFVAPGCAGQTRTQVARSRAPVVARAQTAPLAAAKPARVEAPASAETRRAAPVHSGQDTEDVKLGVRRPLTQQEKDEARKGSQQEMEAAWERAHQQRLSEERLAAGIHRGELRGVDARLRAAQAEIRAPFAGRLREVRGLLDAALAAEAKAREIAEEGRAAARDKERRAGEGLKGKALEEAKKEARKICEETIARIDEQMAGAIAAAFKDKQTAIEMELAIEQEMQPQLDAAQTEADRARARSAELLERALADAAQREQDARRAAAEVHEQNCSGLDTATIADYVASQ